MAIFDVIEIENSALTKFLYVLRTHTFSRKTKTIIIIIF